MRSAHRGRAGNKADDDAYQRARTTNTIAAYESYLTSYPSGRNTSAARTARDKLKTNAADDAAYRKAQTTNTVAAYDSYLAVYPNGRHRYSASAARDKLETAAKPSTAVTGSAAAAPKSFVGSYRLQWRSSTAESWTSSTGPTVTFSSNGTLRSSTGGTGTWSSQGGILVFRLNALTWTGRWSSNVVSGTYDNGKLFRMTPSP